MGRFVVIGEPSRVEGFALAGVPVICAEGAQEVRLAWAALPSDAAVVVLTPRAAAALDDVPRPHDRALVAVMP